jgi:hypothetical protein
VSTFKNADELYEYMGRMFELTVKDPQFVEATRGGDLVVGLHYTDPDATILIDFPGQSVSFGADAASGSPIVELRMSADDGHKFWLGNYNITLGLAKRSVKVSGNIGAMLGLLPALQPAFARYEAYLKTI